MGADRIDGVCESKSDQAVTGVSEAVRSHPDEQLRLSAERMTQANTVLEQHLTLLLEQFQGPPGAGAGAGTGDEGGAQVCDLSLSPSRKLSLYANPCVPCCALPVLCCYLCSQPGGMWSLPRLVQVRTI